MTCSGKDRTGGRDAAENAWEYTMFGQVALTRAVVRAVRSLMQTEPSSPLGHCRATHVFGHVAADFCNNVTIYIYFTFNRQGWGTDCVTGYQWAGPCDL